MMLNSQGLLYAILEYWEHHWDGRNGKHYVQLIHGDDNLLIFLQRVWHTNKYHREHVELVGRTLLGPAEENADQ